MFRLWLTAACLCCLVGCRGYQMGGKWVGPLPLDNADSCRIRFYEGGRFDFVCGEPQSWVGEGVYRVKGDELEMEYSWIAERGAKVENLPMPLHLKLKGQQNHVEASMPTGQILRWERKL